MIKTGEIRPGVTPPEDDQLKSASATPDLDKLADHITKRAADRLAQQLTSNSD